MPAALHGVVARGADQGVLPLSPFQRVVVRTAVEEFARVGADQGVGAIAPGQQPAPDLGCAPRRAVVEEDSIEFLDAGKILQRDLVGGCRGEGDLGVTTIEREDHVAG